MWATERTVQPEQARRVGIVGAGVIGGGWALHYLRMGLDVGVYDPAPRARGDLLRMVEASWPLLERMGLRDGASPDRLVFPHSRAGAGGGAAAVRGDRPGSGAGKGRGLGRSAR